MKKRLKKRLSLLLAVVMVVSSIHISDVNVQAEAASAVPTDVTFQTAADITGTETTAVESGVTAELGQVTDTATGFTFDVNRTTGTGILEIGLYNTASGNLSAGGCKLQLHYADATNVYCWLKRDEWAPKSVAVTDDTMTVHVWNKNNTVHLAVNGELVQTYDISAYGAGTYINVYNGWQSNSAVFTGTVTQDIPADIMFETVADITGVETTTVESGATTGLGQVKDTATGFTFDVNRTTGAGILEIGLYNTVSGDLSAGGCKLQLHHADAANVYCWLKRDEWAPKTVAVTGDTMTVHVWNKNNTVHLAVNGELVQTYDISTFGAGTYINVYNGWQSDSAVFTGTMSAEPDLPPDAPNVINGGLMHSHSNSHADYGIYFAMDANAAPYSGWSYEYTQTNVDNIKLIRDGQTLSIGIVDRPLIVKYGETDYYLKLEGWNVGQYGWNGQANPITTDDILIVEGDFKYGDVTLNITKSYVYFDGSAWVCSATEPDEPPASTVINGGVMQTDSRGFSNNGIYFALDANAAPYNGWDYEYTQTSVDNIKLIRDDETVSIGIVDRPLIVKFGETEYYLKLEGWNVGDYGMNGQPNAITTDDILIVEGDFKYGDVTLNITKSYVYFDGTAWVCSTTEPSEPPVSNVIDGGVMQSHSNSHAAYGIYFALDANAAPYNGWNYEYTQTSVDNIKLIRDGQTLSIGIVDRPLIVKYGETDYYLKLEGWNVGQYGLDGQSDPITTNDILIIEGDFEYGNVTLNITKSYVYFDGSAWVCSATEPDEPTEPIVPDLINAGHLSNHGNGTNGTDGIYAIMAENAAPYDGWSIEYAPVTNDAYYVIRGGERINIGMPGRGTLIKYSDTEYYLRITAWCTDNFAFTTDDIFVIDGLWKQNTGGNAVMKIEKTCLYYDGSDWTFSTRMPFETVADTSGSLTTTVSANGSGSLGKVSSTAMGFTFDLNKLQGTTDGVLRIGLYNTAENDVLKDGYVLLVQNGMAEGTVQFRLYGSGEEDLGQMIETEVDSDPMTVHAWYKGGTMYIAVEEQIILTATGSYTLGAYMNAHNEWTEDAVFTGVVTKEPEPELPTIPDYVTFEDIGVTMTENSLPMVANGAVSFGKISDMKNGFQLKVTVPDTTTKGNVKIGFFNTQVANPWTEGYLVFVSPTEQAGTVRISLNTANTEGERSLSMPTKVSGLADYVTVSLWLEDGCVFLAAEGTVIASWENDGSVKLGQYMSAYSEWEQEGEYRSVNEIVIPPYVDTSVNVAFEDLAITRIKEVMECQTAQSANFGMVTNTRTGFSLIMNALNRNQTHMPVKLGFYNTGEANPWMDGYLVAVRVQEDGKYTFTLYQGRNEVMIKSVSDVALSGSKLRFDAWLTNGNTFHLKVNGDEILTHVDKNKEVAVGQYMAAYNDRSETISFRTVNPIVDTSKDVKFMDLGQTLKLNAMTVIPKMPGDLGRLTSSKNGFAFKISMPPSSDDGKNVKIGIYNMEKKNPWTDGYIFILSPRANGDMGISLRTGNRNGETLLAYPEDLKGLTGDSLTVRAWISDVDGSAHIFHVSVNGTEVITYKNRDGAVKLGTYLSIYQEGAASLEIKTIEEVVEPGDLYLQRYGDPTAMREGDLPENDQDVTQGEDPNGGQNQKNEPQNNLLPTILIVSGTALVLLAAAIVVIFIIARKKK